MLQTFCNLCACFVSCSVRETAEAKYLVASVMVLHTLATPRLWVKVEGHNQSSTKQTQCMVEAYIWNSKILLYGTRAAAKSGHNVISRIICYLVWIWAPRYHLISSNLILLLPLNSHMLPNLVSWTLDTHKIVGPLTDTKLLVLWLT